MNLNFSKGARVITLLSIVALTASCSLPRSGPNKKEIFAGSVMNNGNTYIVGVDDRVARATSVASSFGFSKKFLDAGVLGSDLISSGDVLGITVFENVKDDPLLGNTGQRVSQLTEVQVDGQGFIFIPYAGRIKAEGQTVEGLRGAITRKLDTQTPDPQIQVNRVAGDGSTVTVSGAVGSAGVFPIERPTRTLSAMLAKSGGVSINPSTALVRLTRGNTTGKIWLKDLWANPKMDIALRPGDQIVIEEDERTYVALGATSVQTKVPFETENLSAIEALATVGGLTTMAADPTGVFVFRDESPNIANAVLGRKDLQHAQRIVYVLDLTEPNGIFNARDFMIRDGDTVYVTEAPYVQWNKALSALTGATGTVSNLASTGNNLAGGS